MESQPKRPSLRRSSSRSPSLTRRPSLKEKSSFSGISKLKKKGSKKERWLLTRKTWRYMSDAVGSLLPEHKDKAGSSSPGGPSSSRRPSSTVSVVSMPAPLVFHSTGVVPASHGYSRTIASVPASHGYGTTVTHTCAWPPQGSYHELPQSAQALEKRSGLARSSICSVAPLCEPEPDIPAIEENFENICQKEKKFILWTRTRPKGLSGPALREIKDKAGRRRTSSSSIAGRPETPETPGAVAKRNEEFLEYYSPEDEDLLDDYDEYELDEEQMTVREFPTRKSSSGASSAVSIFSAGHPFWPHHGSAHAHGHSLSSPPPSSDSYTVVTLGPGIQKHFRTTGIQTEQISEEVLERLRLQSVRKQQLQGDDREPEALKLKGVTAEGDPEVESPPPEGQDRKSGQAEDKKSEESGYSSSISDTVMRYLRMVRKNSKSETKDAIDRFKTVNYDRSLRDIKSKNVTVEEALEHEKNKALQQQKGQGSSVVVPEVPPIEKGSDTVGQSKGQSSSAQVKVTKKPSFGSTSALKKKKSVKPLPGPPSSPPSFQSEPMSSPEMGPSPPLSPPPREVLPPPSIGIQAGEPLVGFLKNLNPLRKCSDMSSSYYGSSESPADVMSPRYSITTGSDASEVYSQPVTGDEIAGHLSQRPYYTPGFSHDRPITTSSSNDLVTFYSKNQPSHLSSLPSSYAAEKLKKSSSALQMGLKGSASPSALYNPKDFGTTKKSFSASTPTTPTISPKPGHSDLFDKGSRHGPTYSSSGPVQFLSGLRRKGSSGRDKAGPPSSSPSAYSPGTSGGGIAESISSFLSKRSSYGKSSCAQTKGESRCGGSGSSGLSFSLRRAGSGKSGGTGNAKVSSSTDHSSSLTMTFPSTVMQKSKSSSSVFHGEKRGSTSSAGGVSGIGTTNTAVPSAGSRLMSKTRIFKGRSKSTGRSTPVCSWTPQGNAKWMGQSGQCITITDANLLNLNEKEAEVLQTLIHSRIRALNPGLDVKIPKEPKASVVKPKRRPYVLKKKAMSTGFFESSSNKEESIAVRAGIGNVFGISLAEVIRNDRKREESTVSPESKTAHSTFFGDIGAITRSRQCENGARTTSRETVLAKDKGTGSVESLLERQRGSTGGSTTNIDQEPSTRRSHVGVVPRFVLKCIEFLEENGLQTVGIFRVSSNRMRVRQIREDIESGKDVNFGEDCTVHDVAALLKEFLRDLPEPLLCNDLYQAFLNTQVYRSNRKLQLEATQHIIQLLPIPNRDTLAVLLKFFANVAKHSTDSICPTTGKALVGNKMDSCNLATVIAPNLMPFLTPGGQTLDPATALQSRERRDSIDVIDFMISNHAELFKVSAEVLDEVYHSMLETCPETLESILKDKAGDDAGLDDLDTCSVFGGSELGEPSDVDDAVAPRRAQKREEILHKGAGRVQPDERPQPKAEKGRSRRDQSRDRVGASGEGEKQSGGESDTSSTKSSSRWFRRARPDSKVRTSSDSGSEKAKTKRSESAVWEPKRASSLDSVTLQDTGLGAVMLVTETVEPKRSASHQNLQVPEMLGRRQSSPVLEHGIITASLKIPVPLNLDESDIPYIEEEQLEGRLVLSHNDDSGKSGKVRAQIAASSSDTGRSGTPSSHATTPPSSPHGRLSSASLPFSPPMSPDDTFQYETMTARFLISPNPVFPSTPNTSTVVTQTRLEQLPIKSTLTVLPVESKSSASESRSPLSASPTGSQPSPTPPPKSSDRPTEPMEPKAMGKETKGANIAGLIKSKTADFEKIAKQSQLSPLPCSTISQNLRLRSQGNIQLKQEFLLRQQQTTPPGRRGPSRSGSSGGILVTSTTTAEKHRPLTRKKEPSSPVQKSDDIDTPSSGQSQPQSSQSRWKRSELIASQPTGGHSTGKGTEKN